MMDIKVCLITGAGSGIGQASALALLRLGHTVVLAGRRREALDATAAKAAPYDGQLMIAPTDVADPNAVAELFKTVETHFGRLDVLFNNAGVSAPEKTIDELSYEEWKTVVDINLTGSFLCASRAFDLMRRQDPQGGRIINNGSIAAHVPRPLSAPYATTKHAITGMTKSIALDGRPFDIACGQLDIGNATSEMWDRENAHMLQADGSLAVEPLIDVQHVADSVVHMVTLPLDVNIQTMTVMATKMRYVGRG